MRCICHRPLFLPQQGNVYYIHTDHLGTPRRVSDSDTNTVVWKWGSDSFGATAANDDPDGNGVAFEMNLRFAGQYYDSESGLHYNYFRYYDPKTGRYITADPIGAVIYDDKDDDTPELNHLYAYVTNNPLKFIDPLGLHHGRPHGQMGHGPVGEPGCVSTCIENFIGTGMLAAGGSLAFGALAGSGWVAGSIGYFGSGANALYSNFNLASCLDSCNDDDNECK